MDSGEWAVETGEWRVNENPKIFGMVAKKRKYKRKAGAQTKRKSAYTPKRRRIVKAKKSYGSSGAKKVNPTISKSQWMGLGFPLRVKGMMRTSQVHSAVDTLTGKFMFCYINCVDMNNNQRSAQGTVGEEGVSHVVVTATGIILLGTPHFFDQYGTFYLNYLLYKVSWVMTLACFDTTLTDDITVAWKLIKPHDDANNTLKNTSSVEIIRATPGMNFVILSPAAAGRGGNAQRKTIRGYVNVFSIVPKRVYYSESGETTVGEKTFASTAAISEANAAIGPRFVFWAWKTFADTTLDTDTLGMSLDLIYHYTAYDRVVGAVS